ncbi:hypothetical protein D3C81_1290120 [compost metagenome]
MIETDGGEDGGQVGAQKVGLTGTLAADVAPASYCDVNRTIRQRSDFAFGGAQKRFAHAYHLVDPHLEWGGHVVVVHRRGNQQYVACLQLVDQLVGTAQRTLLTACYDYALIG